MTTDNTVTGVKLLQRRPAGPLYIAECNLAGVVLAATGPVAAHQVEELLDGGNWLSDYDLVDQINANAEDYATLRDNDLYAILAAIDGAYTGTDAP